MNKKFLELFITNCILLTLLFFSPFILGLLFVPRLSELYAEFGADLPLVTKFFVSSTEIFLSFWYLIIPVLSFCILGFAALVSFLLKNLKKKNVLVWNVAVILILCGILVGFIAYSVYLPLFSLTSDIESSGGNEIESERLAPTLGNTAEEMFKYLVEDPIPVEVIKIEGDGDTWQGHLIYLQITLSDESYIDRFLKIRDFERVGCKEIHNEFNLPDGWDDDMPYWSYDDAYSRVCYTASGYSNDWTHAGTGYVAVDKKNLVIYFKEIGS